MLSSVTSYGGMNTGIVGGHGDPDEFQVVLSGRSSIRELQDCVQHVLQEILDTLGVEGYKAKWIEHDFPSTEYEKLKAS
jgi:hypothetical protein